MLSEDSSQRILGGKLGATGDSKNGKKYHWILCNFLSNKQVHWHILHYKRSVYTVLFSTLPTSSQVMEC